MKAPPEWRRSLAPARTTAQPRGQTMAAVTQPANTSCRPASSTHRRNNRVYGVSGVEREKRSRMTAFAPFASFADRCTSVSDNPLSDKEYFPDEPQCVLAVVCLDNPRDNTRGRSYGLRCLHRDPRRNAHGVCQMLYRHGWSVTL